MARPNASHAAILFSPCHRTHERVRFPACYFYFPQVSASEQNKVGMVVIRGNSVVMIEALEKLWGD